MTTNEEANNESSRSDIELEKYKTRYSFYKVAVGTALVGVVSVIIPGAIEYWKATFENQRLSYQYEIDDKRKRTEIELAQINQQQAYVKDFLETALNQDIELRIRFADYFSKVSAEPFREDWSEYRKSLVEVRNSTRSEIHEKEETLLRNLSLETPTTEEQIEIAKLRRELEWRYREIGYLERDRSIVRSEDETDSSSLADIIGTQPAFERVSVYGLKSEVRTSADKVGRLDVRYASGRFTTCSAVALSKERVLTTSHCTSNSPRHGDVEEVVFVHGYYDEKETSSAVRIRLNIIPIYQNEELDISILNVSDSDVFIPVVADFEIRAPVVGEAVSLFHHPGGTPMRVTRSGCRIVSVSEKGFRHTCDTIAGSSGAAIVGQDGVLVGIHIAGNSLPDQPSYAVRADEAKKAWSTNPL